MRLDVYLKQQNLSLGAFAKLAGLSKATVFRARDTAVVPTKRTMERVEAATGGHVTRLDLIGAMKGPAFQSAEKVCEEKS